MDIRHLAKASALIHAGLVAVSVYFVTRVFNFTPLSALPNADFLAFSATAIPPLLAAGIGSWLVRGEKAARVLGYGLAGGAAIYAASLVGVMLADESEPLAPLWLIVVSIWLAAGYAALLIAVWLVGRRAS